MIKHEAISAAQLLGGGGELADDVLPAGGGVGEAGVSQGDPVRSNGLSLRTLKTLDVSLGHGLLTLASKGRGLLLSDTCSLSLVKYQRRRTVVDVRVAVNTVVVSANTEDHLENDREVVNILIAHIGIFMVEESIGSVASWI